MVIAAVLTVGITSTRGTMSKEDPVPSANLAVVNDPNAHATISYKLFKKSDYNKTSETVFNSTHPYTLANATQSVNSYQTMEGMMPGFGATWWSSAQNPLSSYTYDEVKAAVDETKLENIPSSTTFMPGDEVVLVPFIKADAAGFGIVSCAVYPTIVNLGDNITGALPSWATAGTNNKAPNQERGVGFTQANTAALEGLRDCGTISFKIKSSASGSYTIKNSYTDGGPCVFTVSQPGSMNGLASVSGWNSTNWTDTPLTITIGSASPDASLTSLTVKDGSSGSATEIVGSKAQGGITVGGTAYDLYSSSSNMTDDHVYIKGTVANSGTITAVKYSTSSASVLTGTTAASSSNGYDIDMSSVTAGSDMYVAIQSTASDHTTTQWHIVKLTKATSSNSTATSINVTSGSAGASGVTTIKVKDGATDANGITLPVTTNLANARSFYIELPDDMTTLNFTVAFDSSATAKANTTNLTNGSATSVPVPSSGPIAVVVTAQDNSTTTYTFYLQKKNTDASMTGVAVSGGGTGNPGTPISGATVTGPDGSGNFTITGIPYGTGTVDLTPTLPGGGTWSISGGSSNIPSGTAGTVNIGATGSTNVTITVTSPAGNTSTHTVTITPNGPSTNKKIESITIRDNDNQEIGTWDYTNQVYNFPSGFNGLAHAKTSVTITIKAEDPNSTVTIKKNTNGGAATGSNPAASGSQTGTVTYNYTHGTDETALFEYYITDQTSASSTLVPISIKRIGANNDTTFTITGSYVDAAGQTVNLTNSDFGFTTNNVTCTPHLPYEATQVQFTIVPTASTTKFKNNGTDYSNQLFTLSFNATDVSQHTYTARFTAYTEHDQITGTTVDISFIRDAADDTRTMTFDFTDAAGNIQTPDNVVGTTYTYVVTQSTFGSNFYIKNVVVGAKSKAYTSISNSDNTALKSTNWNDADAHPVGTDLYLTVFSQRGEVDGSHTTYTIKTKYTDTRSNVATVDSIDFGGVSFTYSSTKTNYTGSDRIEVPFTTTSINYTASKSDSNSSWVSGANLSGYSYGTSSGAMTLNVGSNFIAFKVKAQNESTYSSEYVVEVYRKPGRTDKFITDLTINGVDCTQPAPGNEYDPSNVFTQYMNSGFYYVFPHNTAQAYINIVVSPGATYEISTTNLGPQSSGTFTPTLTPGGVTTVTVSVKSEAGSVPGSTDPSNVYTFDIYAADQIYSLSDIKLYQQGTTTNALDTGNQPFAFNSTDTTYNFTVPYKTSALDIAATATVTATAGHAEIHAGDTGTKNLTASNTTPNVFTITVQSELAKLIASKNPGIAQSQTSTYTLNITRQEGDNENRLDTFAATPDAGTLASGDITFNPDSNTISISNVDPTATSLNIVVTKKSANSTVEINGDTTGALTKTVNITWPSASSGQFVFSIKVTSETGTPRSYQVTVSRQQVTLNNNNTVSGINLMGSDSEDYTPSYSTTNPGPYAVTVDPMTANATLTLSLPTGVNSTPNIKYTPAGGGSPVTGNNPAQTIPLVQGTTTVEFWAVAEDGTVGTKYTINITKPALDTDATLSDLQFNGTTVPGFSANNVGPYTINVTNSVTNGILTATTSKTTSTISSNNAAAPNGYNLAVGQNQLTITVIAQNTSYTKTYTVNVIRDAEDTLDELHAKVDNVDQISYIDKTSPTTGWSVNLPYEKDSVDISAVPTGGNEVTLSGDLGTISNIPVGTNTFNVVVTTKSGVTRTYEIQVTRAAGSDDNYIETYIGEDGVALSVNHTDTTYEYILPTSAQTFNPTYTVSSNATPQLLSTTALAHGRNEKKIEVSSQTGNKRTYTFIVWVADKDFSIRDINVLNQAGGQAVADSANGNTVEYNSAQTSYSLTVPYSTSQVYLEVEPTSALATVFKNGATFTSSLVSLNPGTNTISVYAISDYGMVNTSAQATATSPTYTITIERETPNTDSTLKKLTVTYIDDDGNTQTISCPSLPNPTPFTIPNIGNSVTSVTIAAEPNVPAPKTTLSGDLGAKQLGTLVSASSGYIFNYNVTCTAEDGSSTTYPIVIARGPLDLDADNTISYIEVVDSNNTQYLGQSSFNSSILVYPASNEYVIPYGATSYTITIVKLAVSPSVCKIDGAALAAGVTSKQFTITTAMQGTTKSHKVQCVAQNGTPGVEYTVNVSFEAPSRDATLMDLLADGARVNGFTPTDQGGTYTLATRNNSTTTINLAATVNDPKASVSGVGNFPLQVGLNSFTVTVTAQDGSILNYIINVTRDYPLPYLTNLEVVGEQLLDASDVSTTFNKEVLEYHVIVSYFTLVATINASVDNPNHLVTCSNTTTVTNTGLTRVFTSPLAEGTNNFTVVVTSTEGKSQSYKLVIQRRGLASTNTNIAPMGIWIDEIPQFKTDYTNLKTHYDGYTVDNEISELHVHVTPEKGPDSNGSGATYAVYNAKDLEAGLNQVIIVVTAEDGITSRVIVVEVERAALDYTVNPDAYKNDKGIVAEEVKKNEIYTIPLGGKKPSEIADYTKYIVPGEKTALTVETITDTADDNCNEVVVKISDGSQEKLVTLKLDHSLKFNVNTEATDYTVEEKLSEAFKHNYVVNMNNDPAGKIEDYTAFIEADEDVVVTVLSNTGDRNCREVLVSVDNGYEEEIVRFEINTTAASSGSLADTALGVGPWIFLGLAIILLIIILICVNRDKYGSVNKKRKKAE